MWWEDFTVAPVRPENADKGWHRAELVLRQVGQLEKVVKAAGVAQSIGWWLGPWRADDKGHQAVVTFYFEKQTQVQSFLVKPPAPIHRNPEEQNKLGKVIAPIRMAKSAAKPKARLSPLSKSVKSVAPRAEKHGAAARKAVAHRAY